MNTKNAPAQGARGVVREGKPVLRLTHLRRIYIVADNDDQRSSASYRLAAIVDCDVRGVIEALFRL
jgi:hypothetical protein